MIEKQSIWCEITKNNYNKLIPQILITDECPICKKHGITCLIQNHKTENFKYFYAYSNPELKELDISNH